MFTRSAQVVAVVFTLSAVAVLSINALAGPLAVVFPLMAVAVAAMGVEQGLLPFETALARSRADHEKVVGSPGVAARTIAIRRNCVSH
ncbi:MAG: hypothetical protein AAFO29_08470 [Actinomycetota bacterium]